MQYNGKELVEMSSENWDGKSREMIVWTNASNPAYKDVCHIKTVIGYNPRKLAWVVDDKGLVYWPHCAEIPKESNQEQKIDEMIKILTAYKEGKTIEYRFSNRKIGDSWACIHAQKPIWNWDMFEYRVKQEQRRMTYRELDEWLKQGKGVCKLFSHLTNKVYYWPSRMDNEVEDGILICAFGNSNFEEPLIGK